MVRTPNGLVRSAGAPAASGGTLRPSALTVNGLVDPVGVDPDDCSFAWALQASGRAVAQTASRIVVRRTDPAQTRARLGQRHGAVRSPGLRRLRGTVPRRRRGVRVDGAAAGPGRPLGAGLGPGPVHDGAAGGRLAGPVAAARRQFRSNPTASPTCAPRSRRRQAPSAAPPPTSPRPTRTGCTSTGRRWTPGPASRIPTSSTRVPST